MKLIKYRDPGMHTYTYFWINAEERIVSPYFDSEEQANEWLKTSWDNWKLDKSL
jgi:hypothetical protein